MSQTTRIVVAVVILVVLIGAVFGIELVRRGSAAVEADVTLVPGAIPIYWNGKLVAGFGPDNLETLEQVSFVDAEEGKTQEGWMLRDVLLLYLDADQLDRDTAVLVSSSANGKEAILTWEEVEDPANWVMFDLAGRGTLKLVSTLERLDVRDEWIQDVDRIEVGAP
jgi:hypothetical protein